MVTVWCGDGHESTIEPTVQSVTEGGGLGLFTWTIRVEKHWTPNTPGTAANGCDLENVAGT